MSVTSTAKHKFTYSKGKDAVFKPGGLRDYFVDRDLGVKKATGGMVMAEVHKACGPCPEGGSGMHIHKLDFQFNYVLKGWFQAEFEGEGAFVFEAGDSWLQPPGIKHNVTSFSEDLEILEITMPGDFETEEA